MNRPYRYIERSQYDGFRNELYMRHWAVRSVPDMRRFEDNASRAAYEMVMNYIVWC